MKCEIAQKVWAHPKGPIAGLKKELPGVMERLESLAARFVSGGEDSFDKQVKALAGEGNFLVVHADDNDPLTEDVHSVVGDAAMNVVLTKHFESVYGRAVVFGNVCCSGCITQDGTLDGDRLIAIQQAAVTLQ